ncbi:hypothetical protein vBSlqSZDD2_29 [Serratia phage vB_SlqS_ZDD2]|nr:hypothetical protein vBSlqSZDD2_29 [Serratia phage vB_SlqS_ZDD2]
MNKAHYLGVSLAYYQHPYTEEEVALIRAMKKQGSSAKDIAAATNRTPQAIGQFFYDDWIRNNWKGDLDGSVN